MRGGIMNVPKTKALSRRRVLGGAAAVSASALVGGVGGALTGAAPAAATLYLIPGANLTTLWRPGSGTQLLFGSQATMFTDEVNRMRLANFRLRTITSYVSNGFPVYFGA